MRRRRLTAAVTASVVVAGIVVARGAESGESSPAEEATTTVQVGNPARPLTYAEGRTIHLGDRTIGTSLDLLSLDVTDDGAAFTTFDGSLWFTDGTAVTQIGLTNPGRVTDHGVDWGLGGRPNDRIVSANSGSRLAWLEYSRLDDRIDRPEIVVYDTHERQRVARVPIDPAHQCARCARIVSVHGDDVYWTDSLERGFGSSDRRPGRAALYRVAMATGKQSRVSVASYRDLLRRSPRMLVVGATLVQGTVEDGINQDFAFVGRRLVAGGRGTGRPTYDAVSGKRVLLDAPQGSGYGFGAAERLYLFQWLDDDRFVLLDGTDWNAGKYSGEDFVVCRLSSGSCTVAVRRPASAGSPIVPEIGSPGAERAQVRAVRAAQR
jgi:hypothetical protein